MGKVRASQRESAPPENIHWVDKLGSAVLEDQVPDEFSIPQDEYGNQPLRHLDQYIVFSAEDPTEMLPLERLEGEDGIGGGEKARLGAVGVLVMPEGAHEEADQETSLLVRLPNVVEWCIDYGEPPSLWILTDHAWYELLEPAKEYAGVFSPTRRKYDMCVRTAAMLRANPRVSYKDGCRAVLNSVSNRGRERQQYTEQEFVQEGMFVLAQLTTLAQEEEEETADTGQISQLHQGMTQEGGLVDELRRRSNWTARAVKPAKPTQSPATANWTQEASGGKRKRAATVGDDDEEEEDYEEEEEEEEEEDEDEEDDDDDEDVRMKTPGSNRRKRAKRPSPREQEGRRRAYPARKTRNPTPNTTAATPASQRSTRSTRSRAAKLSTPATAPPRANSRKRRNSTNANFDEYDDEDRDENEEEVADEDEGMEDEENDAERERRLEEEGFEGRGTRKLSQILSMSQKSEAGVSPKSVPARGPKGGTKGGEGGGETQKTRKQRAEEAKREARRSERSAARERAAAAKVQARQQRLAKRDQKIRAKAAEKADRREARAAKRAAKEAEKANRKPGKRGRKPLEEVESIGETSSDENNDDSEDFKSESEPEEEVDIDDGLDELDEDEENNEDNDDDEDDIEETRDEDGDGDDIFSFRPPPCLSQGRTVSLVGEEGGGEESEEEQVEDLDNQAGEHHHLRHLDLQDQHLHQDDPQETIRDQAERAIAEGRVPPPPAPEYGLLVRDSRAGDLLAIWDFLTLFRHLPDSATTPTTSTTTPRLSDFPLWRLELALAPEVHAPTLPWLPRSEAHDPRGLTHRGCATGLPKAGGVGPRGMACSRVLADLHCALASFLHHHVFPSPPSDSTTHNQGSKVSKAVQLQQQQLSAASDPTQPWPVRCANLILWADKFEVEEAGVEAALKLVQDQGEYALLSSTHRIALIRGLIQLALQTDAMREHVSSFNPHARPAPEDITPESNVINTTSTETRQLHQAPAAAAPVSEASLPSATVPSVSASKLDGESNPDVKMAKNDSEETGPVLKSEDAGHLTSAAHPTAAAPPGDGAAVVSLSSAATTTQPTSKQVVSWSEWIAHVVHSTTGGTGRAGGVLLGEDILARRLWVLGGSDSGRRIFVENTPNTPPAAAAPSLMAGCGEVEEHGQAGGGGGGVPSSDPPAPPGWGWYPITSLPALLDWYRQIRTLLSEDAEEEAEDPEDPTKDHEESHAKPETETPERIPVSTLETLLSALLERPDTPPDHLHPPSATTAAADPTHPGSPGPPGSDPKADIVSHPDSKPQVGLDRKPEVSNSNGVGPMDVDTTAITITATTSSSPVKCGLALGPSSVQRGEAGCVKKLELGPEPLEVDPYQWTVAPLLLGQQDLGQSHVSVEAMRWTLQALLGAVPFWEWHTQGLDVLAHAALAINSMESGVGMMAALSVTETLLQLSASMAPTWTHALASRWRLNLQASCSNHLAAAQTIAQLQVHFVPPEYWISRAACTRLLKEQGLSHIYIPQVGEEVVVLRSGYTQQVEAYRVSAPSLPSMEMMTPVEYYRVEALAFRRGRPVKDEDDPGGPLQCWLLLCQAVTAVPPSPSSEPSPNNTLHSATTTTATTVSQHTGASHPHQGPGTTTNTNTASAGTSMRRVCMPLHLEDTLPEYIVPAATFNTSMQRHWQPGDIFRMYFSTGETSGETRSLFPGRVVRVESQLDDDGRPDPWESVVVEWQGYEEQQAGGGSGQQEEEEECSRVSPWEMEVDATNERRRERERNRRVVAGQSAMWTNQAVTAQQNQQQHQQQLYQQHQHQHHQHQHRQQQVVPQVNHMYSTRGSSGGSGGIPTGFTSTTSAAQHQHQQLYHQNQHPQPHHHQHHQYQQQHQQPQGTGRLRSSGGYGAGGGGFAVPAGAARSSNNSGIFSAANPPTCGAKGPVQVPPYEAFQRMLEEFHAGYSLGQKFRVPVFCHVPLDMHKVFTEVQNRGGYEVVTKAKMWKEVCRTLNCDLTGQTSASFSMRTIFQKFLLPFELFLEHRQQHQHQQATAAADPPPSSSSSDPPTVSQAQALPTTTAPFPATQLAPHPQVPTSLPFASSSPSASGSGGGGGGGDIPSLPSTSSYPSETVAPQLSLSASGIVPPQPTAQLQSQSALPPQIPNQSAHHPQQMQPMQLPGQRQVSHHLQSSQESPNQPLMPHALNQMPQPPINDQSTQQAVACPPQHQSSHQTAACPPQHQLMSQHPGQMTDQSGVTMMDLNEQSPKSKIEESARTSVAVKPEVSEERTLGGSPGSSAGVVISAPLMVGGDPSRHRVMNPVSTEIDMQSVPAQNPEQVVSDEQLTPAKAVGHEAASDSSLLDGGEGVHQGRV